MSGHSKWHSIKRKKGVADQKRAAVFTKLAKGITVAAREGGGDPEMNFALRLAIEKAKQSNMPKDNIDRAIKRGTGEGSENTIVEAVYEGMGPGNVSFIVRALTDNTNRAVTNIKTIFTKNGGNFGASTLWQFDKKGVIRIENVALEGTNLDELELELIDAGADDIDRSEEGMTIYSPVAELKKLTDLVREKGIALESSGIEYVPNTTVEVTDPALEEKLERFMEALDEDEDVDDYFTNVA